MQQFTRKIRDAYQGRRHKGRPAKLRKIKAEIDEAKQSPIQITLASTPGEFEDAVLTEPSVPVMSEQPEQRMRKAAEPSLSSAMPAAMESLTQEIIKIRENNGVDKSVIDDNGATGRVEVDTQAVSPTHDAADLSYEHAMNLSDFNALQAPDEPWMYGSEEAKAIDNEQAGSHVPSVTSSQWREICDSPEPYDPEEGDPAYETATKQWETYIGFSSEDETDYTSGPPRFVFASDGLKDRCAALLMTFDLSRLIRDGIESQRTYHSMDLNARGYDRMYFDFERKLETQIAKHESYLVANDANEKPGDAELFAIKSELAKLNVLLENTQLKRQAIAAELQTAADTLRQLTSSVMVRLDDAFQVANLIGPDRSTELDSPLPELTVEGEHEEHCRLLRNDRGGEEVDVPIIPLHECRENFVAPALSAEEQAQANLRDAYWYAKQGLQAAQLAFDRREVDSALKKRERQRVRANETEENIDLRWLAHQQELTRNLVDAGARVASTKGEAMAARADLACIDQESCFPDDVDEGYQISEEKDLIKSVSQPKIANWLSDVPSAEPSPCVDTATATEAVEEW